MLEWTVWKKAWALLDRHERRNAVIVLAIIVFAAAAAAFMVVSVMPFLSVLADPSKIFTVAAFERTYNFLGLSSTYEFLIILGLGSLAVIIASSLLQLLRIYAVERYSRMRVHAISHRLLASYLNRPYEYFLSSHSGDMGTRILSETITVVGEFYNPAANAVASMLTIIALIALLLWVNIEVAIIASLVLGGCYGATFYLSRRLVSQLGKNRAARNTERFRIVSEALGGVKEIKLLGRERSYLDRYHKSSRAMAFTVALANLMAQVPQYVMQAIAFGLMIALCLVLLDPNAVDNRSALGDLLPALGVFAFAGQRLLPELQNLYRCLTQMRFGAPVVERLHADMFGGVASGSLPSEPATALGLASELRLDNVSYSYPGAEGGGLVGVSLSISAGEKIGVVGSTGAGKTTLADLLLGLLRPTRGTILVDGTPLTNSNLRAWQQSVGYVPQGIFLIDASVAQNVAFGLPKDEIDMARVRRVVEIAQLDRFVREELPEGYDTTLGERGIRLSGGQLQRIGIARALYKESANLIVFDEATSALDNLTESEVIKSIETLPTGLTIVMIAHRLSTLKVCDRIVVLDKGRVVGLGTWEELVNSNRTFRKLSDAVTK